MKIRIHYRRISERSAPSDVVDRLSVPSVVPALVKHFLFIARQTTLHFLIPALPTPLWFVKSESNDTLLLGSG